MKTTSNFLDVSELLEIIPPQNVQKWERKNLFQGQTIKALYGEYTTLAYTDPIIIGAVCLMVGMSVCAFFLIFFAMTGSVTSFPLTFLSVSLGVLIVVTGSLFFVCNRKNTKSEKRIAEIRPSITRFILDAAGFGIIKKEPCASLPYSEYFRNIAKLDGPIEIHDWIVCFAFQIIEAEEKFSISCSKSKRVVGDVVYEGNQLIICRDEFVGFWDSAVFFEIVDPKDKGKVFAEARQYWETLRKFEASSQEKQ